jgi:hypothetical protein
MIFEFFPLFHGSRVGLMSLHEPVIPATSKGDCIELRERLTLAVSFSAQCRYARFNFGFPLTKARFCIMTRRVRRELEMCLTLISVEARVLSRTSSGMPLRANHRP